MKGQSLTGHPIPSPATSSEVPSEPDPFDESVALMRGADEVDDAIVRYVRTSEKHGQAATLAEIGDGLTLADTLLTAGQVADRVDALCRLGVLEREGVSVRLSHGPMVVGEVT